MEELDEMPELTAQFFVTLRARFARIDPEALAGDRLVSEYETIRKLLENGKTWREAYEIEQRMCQILDEATLRTEAGRRLVEARTNLSPAMVEQYASRVDQATVEDKRSLLTRIVDDLQWRYQKDEAQSSLRRRASSRASTVLSFAVVIFMGIYFLNSYGRDAVIVLAAMSGVLGAAFSFVLRLPTRLEGASFSELKLATRISASSVRLALGAAAATIVFFMVQSQALGGKILPEFRRTIDIKSLDKTLKSILRAELTPRAKETPTAKADVLSPQKLATAAQRTEALSQARRELVAREKDFAAASEVVASKVDRLAHLMAMGESGREALRKEVAALVSALPKELSSPEMIVKFLDALDSADRDSARELDDSNLALLIIWCILAGFSERFVPNLLDGMESKVRKGEPTGPKPPNPPNPPLIPAGGGGAPQGGAAPPLIPPGGEIKPGGGEIKPGGGV